MSKKYWDVIPPEKRKQPDASDRFKRLQEAMDKLEKENRENMPYRMPFTRILPDMPDRFSGCLHNNCPKCHGTGISPMGACIHMISCPCPSCSPRMMMSAQVVA